MCVCVLPYLTPHKIVFFHFHSFHFKESSLSFQRTFFEKKIIKSLTFTECGHYLCQPSLCVYRLICLPSLSLFVCFCEASPLLLHTLDGLLATYPQRPVIHHGRLSRVLRR